MQLSNLHNKHLMNLDREILKVLIKHIEKENL